MCYLKDFKNSPYGEIYNTAFQIWMDNKLTGIGLNNFTYLCENDDRYKDKIKNYNCVSHPHNIYLQWLVETGIIGFFLFYLGLFLLFFLHHSFQLLLELLQKYF